MHIAFAHPDLGIGGAERWLADSVKELEHRGHTVTVYTSHHDKQHCFPETLRMNVVVFGDFLPTNIFGKFHLTMAMIRSFFLAAYIYFFCPRQFDVIVVDQISFAVPIFKRCAQKCLFYCHYPDKLLAPKSTDYLRTQIYRRLLDWLEEKTICTCIIFYQHDHVVQADKIIVNSKFTSNKFLEAFHTTIDKPSVLYPGVEDTCKDETFSEKSREDIIFFSLQRFDRKKRVDLAVRAFHEFLEKDETGISKHCRLVIAGGYDKRVAENREYLKELQDQCLDYNLPYHTAFNARLQDLASGAQVLFLPSVTDQLKRHLYRHSHYLIFTSNEEHFGLVPVEAQMYKLPVIAVDAGGPKETVIDGKTGFLVADSSTAIANCMAMVLNKSANGVDYKEMSQSARRHALDKFGIDRFGSQLERLLYDIVSE